MERCKALVDVGRRRFLTGASIAAAGAAAATLAIPEAKSAPAPARVDYPSNRIGNTRDLKVNEPVDVSYPDKDAPGVLLKLGKRVPGGAGPDGDIVASPRSVRTRVFRSSTAKAIARSIAPGTIRASIAKPAASRSGARRLRTLRNTRSASTPTATSTPKASTSFCTAGCPTCSEGGSDGLQATSRSPSDRPGGRQGIQCHLPLLHRRLRL